MRTKRGRPGAVTAEDAANAIRDAAEHFQEPTRTALVDFLQALSNVEPECALRCANNAAGTLFQLSEFQQSTFLADASSLADLTGAGAKAAASFFLHCVDLPLFLDEDDLKTWMEEGCKIGGDNPQAAEAYFSRESAASISMLQKLRRSVHVGEVGRLFKLYCTATGGKAIDIKSTEDAPADLTRAGHHLPLTDGETIFLPDHLNKHVSHEENFEEYKVLAAHQAGYIEFGTFELDIDALLDHAAFARFAEKGAAPLSEAITSHYELFFRLFDNRQLARDIFFAIEDARVDFQLRRKYPGLSHSLRRIAEATLIERPNPTKLPLREALVESLIRLSIAGRIEDLLPSGIMPVYQRICGIFSRILNSAATVNDSAVATANVYLLLQALPNISLQSSYIEAAIKGIETRPDTEPAGAAPQFGEQIDLDIPADESQSYAAAMPVPYRGQTKPEIVQLEKAIELLRDAMTDAEELGIPLTNEMLQELLKKGVKIQITQMTSKELAEASGLFITDLEQLPQSKIEELSDEEKKKLAKLLEQATVIKTEEPRPEPTFYYDEWDYLIGDYRPRWCTLREIPLEGGTSDIALEIRKEQSALISAVRRHFQRIRPEMLRRVKRLRSGEEIELDDVIQAAVDRRVGLTPSDRIYQQRERRERDVATAFLLDLSASTDEWISKVAPEEQEKASADSRKSLFERFAKGTQVSKDEMFSQPEGSKRVIDIEREALVIMAEALESLGDEYAIYGFSGYGRDSIEFFPVKEFMEAYSERVRCRIGAMKPRKSTRMGPAIRHSLEKLTATDSRMKVLILLSDGYPQDFDYGPDRSSRDYGLHDTAMALQEARRKGIHTFCVTVDQAGNDYLKEMCGGDNYLVVERPSALPRILPRIYRGLTV
jgi:nitric oxide reductase activation protein